MNLSKLKPTLVQLLILASCFNSSLSFADGHAVPPVSEPAQCAEDDKPAMMIVEGDNQKPEQFQAYTKALQEAQIYEQLNGYYMAVGDPVEVFEGSWPEQKFMVVARFACIARAQQFWHSEAYRKIKPLRQGAGDVRSLLFEEFSKPERIDWVK